MALSGYARVSTGGVAELYGISTATVSVYRALKTFHNPRAAHKADRGKPRLLPQAEMERYCELIAALKLRANKQARHISTQKAIELMEDHGIETEQGLVKVPKGLLRRPTVDRHLLVTIESTTLITPCASRLSIATTAGNSIYRSLILKI